MSRLHKTPRERFKEFVLQKGLEHIRKWSEAEGDGEDPAWDTAFFSGAESAIDWLMEEIDAEKGLCGISTERRDENDYVPFHKPTWYAKRDAGDF